MILRYTVGSRVMFLTRMIWRCLTQRCLCLSSAASLNKKNIYRSNTTWEMQNAGPPGFQISRSFRKKCCHLVFFKNKHPSFQHLKMTTRRRNGIVGDATSFSCHAKANAIEVAPISSYLVVGILKLNNSGRNESMAAKTRDPKGIHFSRSLSVFLLHLGDKVRRKAHGLCVCVCVWSGPTCICNIELMFDDDASQPALLSRWFSAFTVWGDMMGICDLPAWRVFFLGSLLLHVHSFKCHTLHLSRLLGWMVALWLLRPCRVAQLACLRCCRPIVVRNMSTCVALCDGMALKGDKTICWGLCFARFFPYCFMVDILNDSQVDVEDVNSWSTLWYRRFYRGVE